MACASCHVARHAFAQSTPVPVVGGHSIGTRNAPSLLDLPYFTVFFWDGRGQSLRHASVAAFTNRAEMAQPNMSTLLRSIQTKASYRAQFKLAFGDDGVD
ncbi:cytochrome-c peroxidase, partial [Xanthomonas maliensis]